MSQQKSASIGKEEQRVLDLAIEMGQILLQCGAEIFRVEDTMRRVCCYFNVETGSFFTMGNGIFITAGGTYANVKHIPMKGAQLNKVIAINQLSREIAQGKYASIDEVEDRVQEIKKMPVYRNIYMFLASALASASFCILFGGSLRDTIAAFIAGFIVYVCTLQIGAPMSKIVNNIFGGAVATICCLVAYKIGFGENLSPMIGGAILPLVPGVAFTNAIRDVSDGDYLSGTVRLLDAVWAFLCIAIGVGFVFSIYQRMGGAML